MASKSPPITNPFRPGAGHMPPYLAGRDDETREFRRLLKQDVVLENLVLTGLRGLGKTVLLETFKPLAIQEGWLWAGNDLSESTSISEENLATRLLTDLSVVTSQIEIGVAETSRIGLSAINEQVPVTLDYTNLRGLFDTIPGLIIDKLKGVLEAVAPLIARTGKRGLIFAYDEAQNLADHAAKEHFPLSLLLDLFQSIQRKNIRMMLALVGLPTLFPKLVEARTFAERMFHVIVLSPLTRDETSDAMRRPIRDSGCKIDFRDESVEVIWKITQGYPYFVQFVCRESFDVWVQNMNHGRVPDQIPVDAILRKLDSDFFAGRWARSTDRQRDLLAIIASLPHCHEEFAVQEVVESAANRELGKTFSGSHVNQMLGALAEAGLVYKNRHGRYSLAVPLLGDFIRRTLRRAPGS